MEIQPGNLKAPVQPQQRIQELDVIRGFALFGILLVNMTLFKAPLFYTFETPTELPGVFDQAGRWLIQLLATGKFYAIFSFLFGLGFYIFIERLMSKGFSPVSLFRRRLFGLLLFGLVHLLLIWSGDILFYYAVIGFILLAFRNKEPASLPRWIGAMFIVSLIFQGALFFLYSFSEVMLEEQFAAQQAAIMERAVEVFRQGTFGEILLHRLLFEVSGVILVMIFTVPGILAYFLCGLYAGKTGIFKDVPAQLPFIRRVWRWGLALGALFSLLYVMVETGVLAVPYVLELSVLEMLNHASAIFLSAFYVSSLLLLLQREAWKRKLAVLAAPGRMALTNYLGQSVICVLVFYGYGLGYFGQVSVWGGILLTCVIVGVQVILSNLWMSRYHYGPLEWLWRAFTYRKRPPMKKVHA